MNTIKITLNLLFEYQCTSGTNLSDCRIESNRKNRFDIENRIKSKLFCPNWNVLVPVGLLDYRAYGSGADPGLAVSLQVTWVINPAVGCHCFPPGPQLPWQPLRGLLPVSLLGEQRR